MSGLRFCMVTTFYPPHNFGGDGIGIQRFCLGLVRRGHQVTVVHNLDAYRALAEGPDPVIGEEPPGLTHKWLRSRKGFATVSALLSHQFGRPMLLGRYLRKVMDQGRFDVINYHNVSLIGGPGVLSFGKALKLYMAHEHWLVCPSHVLWRHNREPCTGRECFRCVLSYRRIPQYWRYSGYLGHQLDAVDTFIAMSRFSRDKHREFGFPRDMEVLPYFLPDPDPRETEVHAGESPHPRPYFLFVGRLERIKGLDDVLPVFREYRDADLLVAGDGEHGPALRAAARDIPGVKFLGRLAPADLPRYYRHARALIVPSVGFETFGIVLIEAFRQRLPVIARRMGPFPEIVQTARAGELFSTREELVRALRRLQQEPGLRDRMGEEGYQAFLENWTESAVLPRYLGIVRKTAERRGNRRVLEALADEVTA